jgi:hypothetical protein
MERIEINIIDDILKSPMALHDFGIPVRKVINEKISDIVDPTLVVLNLKGANPMDYEFVNISFNEIIKCSQTNNNLFIAFKVDNSEFDELCTGIIDILGYKTEKGEAERSTLEKKSFSMIYIDGKGDTLYLSSLSQIHMDVLKEIESHPKLSDDQIKEKFKLNVEDTYKILNSLLENKFIIRFDGPVYTAVKTFI